MCNKEKVCNHCSLYPCKRTKCNRKLVWRNHHNEAVEYSEYLDVLDRNMRVTKNGGIPLNFIGTGFRKAGVSK